MLGGSLLRLLDRVRLFSCCQKDGGLRLGDFSLGDTRFGRKRCTGRYGFRIVNGYGCMRRRSSSSRKVRDLSPNKVREYSICVGARNSGMYHNVECHMSVFIC